MDHDLEDNLELLFVRHTLTVMGDPPNLRPDLDPGGDWETGKVRLTWGLRTITEPPTLSVTNSTALAAPYLPREIDERILCWKHKLISGESELDFRSRVLLTVILAWTPPSS